MPKGLQQGCLLTRGFHPNSIPHFRDPIMGVCAVVSERRGGAAVSSRVVGRPEEGRTVGDRRREPAPRALGDPGLPLVAMLSPLLGKNK
jgi:hypothetical protein